MTDSNPCESCAAGAKNGNRFGVGSACTRVQAATFLWSAAGKPMPTQQASFDDMTNNPVYNNALSWAVENHITGGTGNNKFSPNQPCRREQIVALLYNAYQSPKTVSRAQGGPAFLRPI